MRVRRVSIASWRNLRDVQLEVPDEAAVVCLVGENGTGKSTVLELLSAAAHQLGISQGVEISRGNPLEEPHEIEIVVQVPLADLAMPAGITEQLHQHNEQWTGQLLFTSMRRVTGESSTAVSAPEVQEPNLRAQVAQHAVQALRARQETQHLYLDADRSYPPVQIQAHQFPEIWNAQWDSPEWTRQWAYRPTRTLYEEWNKYFLALEERVSTEHIAAIRRARQVGAPPPEFEDPFDGYRAAVQTVLPHLQFVGVQSSGATRTIVFDSAGLEIPFSRLSGGEREIAFLIGQIDRFRLRRGLLLIDEPELHLNPDLLRTWIAYLRDTVTDGQVWIATHSLEAVEVAGPEATFVFEKDRDSRLVHGAQPLAGRPVITALSAAIGAPAFSVSRLKFVFVEGDRQTRERERFFDVCGGAVTNRFIEGGSCHEVLRRLEHVRELADETGEQLHVGGILDRDFRSDHEVQTLESSR